MSPLGVAARSGGTAGSGGTAHAGGAAGSGGTAHAGGAAGSGGAAAGFPALPGGAAPAGRFELLRALGELSSTSPAASAAVSRALGLEAMSAADHTRVFVLDLPPFASIHLGAEGKLGGEGADRVAGLWRALGLTPPADPDHLAVLLGLYAELAEASRGCRTEAARRRLEHARTVLLAEHLASWLPGYLIAASGYPAVAAWAALTAAALRRELEEVGVPEQLPVALRDAPPGPARASGAGDLLDALVAPLRAGFVLTHQDLEDAGATTGLGVRRGERRYALQAMFDQDPLATCGWLADHALRWSSAHRESDGPFARWWASRARETASALADLPHLRLPELLPGGGLEEVAAEQLGGGGQPRALPPDEVPASAQR